MTLVDVNVLVYAHREDSEHHEVMRAWLDQRINSDHAFGTSELVLSGFLRIVTHPPVFNQPSPLEDALRFVAALREAPNCIVVAPGPRHWGIFIDLCRKASARGNLVADAYHAALAVESGAEWASTDRDFVRFPGLRLLDPRAASG